MSQQDTDQIFREVDEELRKERFEQLWQEYGTYLAAAALALVVAVGGWKFYEWRQTSRAAEAGSQFNAALIQLEGKKPEDAEKALRQLSAGGQSGYRALARMRLAGIEQGNGRLDEAVKIYEAVAADGGADPMLRGLGSLKAAMLRIDTADWTEMQNRLTPLKDAKNPWNLSAKELLGLAAWKAGKLPEAEVEFQSLIESRATPQGMRQRAEMMLTLLLDSGKAATAPPQADVMTPVQPAADGPKGPAPKAGKK